MAQKFGGFFKALELSKMMKSFTTLSLWNPYIFASTLYLGMH
jgi:hypothetical protein